MKMFIAAGWRDGMKNSIGMRDEKSRLWSLFYVPHCSYDFFIHDLLFAK